MSELDAQPLETMDVLLQPTIEEKTEAAPQAVATQTTGAGNYVLVALNLAKSSGIYAVGMLASPLVSLLLTPFLAYQLSPADYGIQTVLMTMVGLAVGFTQLGLSVAFFRAYNYEFTDPDDRRVVLATVMGLLFLVSLLTAIVAVLLAPTLAGLLLGNSSLGGLVILACYVVVVQNLTVPALCWLRAENRPVFFSLLYIGNVLILLGATLALVGLLHWGVAGSLVAIGSGYASIALFTLPLILRRSTWRLRTNITWSLLTFGVPQVLSYISYWVLQLSDRYLLSLFVSLAQTASYAVAYSLGSVLATLVITPFVLAWPSVMFSVAGETMRRTSFRRSFAGSAWCYCWLLLASQLLAPWCWIGSFRQPIMRQRRLFPSLPNLSFFMASTMSL